MRSRNGRWDTGLLERHLRIVLAGLMGVERLRSGTTSGADSAGLRIWTCFPRDIMFNINSFSSLKES